MRKTFIFCLLAILVAGCVSRQKAAHGLALVQGGTFKNPKSNYHGKGISLAGFYIGKWEVTQTEWVEVMGSNPSKFVGGNRPVEMVTWYDCVEYCNKRSRKEGLHPYYNIDRNQQDPANENDLDDLKWTVTIHPGANGYRLPTEAEWEYAAGGGQASQGFTYSGGNDLDKVAWYWKNSGDTNLAGFWSWPVVEQNHDQTKPVGGKAANELGLYDMSGNVREWCWDWYGDLESNWAAPKATYTARVWRGGGWMGGDFCCASAFRGSYEANGRAPDQGFRVCRGQ